MRFSKYANINVSYVISLPSLKTLHIFCNKFWVRFFYITTMDLALNQLIDILIRLIDLTLFI